MPTIGNPDVNNNEEPIVNAWWPEISLVNARQIIRVNSDVPEPRLRNVLTTAMFRANRDLNDFKAANIEKGVASVDDLDNSEEIKHHYLTAVFSYCEADLINTYRDYDTSGKGHDRADEFEERIASLLANARRAMNVIKNKPFSVVELI